MSPESSFETIYEAEIASLFKRFPSVQTASFRDAYKPGLDRMREFSALLGNPQDRLRTVHIAGTNGKGSTASMLASVLSAGGARAGLYTSPHILDFRERARIVEGEEVRYIGKEYILDFISRNKVRFEELGLSFFEITTAMALCWFADEGVTVAVIEAGLGGRLDSTNILVRPELAIVTSIGLDHCELLGDTPEAIAAEKAGIFKKGVPALAGERDDRTAQVFIGAAAACNAPLYFASDHEEEYAARIAAILPRMDLRGEYQRKNLLTVLKALDILCAGTLCAGSLKLPCAAEVDRALEQTAARTAFHGRWERLHSHPEVICDIAHNAHALRHNFAQLRGYGARRLVIVYAVMADKDLDAILPLMPEQADYIFTTPATPRAMPAAEIRRRFLAATGAGPSRARVSDNVAQAVRLAMELAGREGLVYVGGSTFAVSEATLYLSSLEQSAGTP